MLSRSSTDARPANARTRVRPGALCGLVGSVMLAHVGAVHGATTECSTTESSLFWPLVAYFFATVAAGVVFAIIRVVQSCHQPTDANEEVTGGNQFGSGVMGPTEGGRENHESWQITYSDLKFGKRIGLGNMGAVYEGRYRGRRVAIKKLLGNWYKNRDMVQRFREEINLMRVMQHPNVLLFLGAVMDVEAGNMCLVTELCSGNLYELLHSTAPLSWLDRLTMAIDTAKGMNYLHLRARIIQRDLKSANILVDTFRRIRIADFGLARSIQPGQMETYCGTPANMAPEIVRQEEYDEKADVFSFAIIMWELVTRADPYPGMSGMTIALEVANNGRRPQIPAFCPEEYAWFMVRAWDQDPKKRPSFEELFDGLRQLQDKLNDKIARDQMANLEKKHGLGVVMEVKDLEDTPRSTVPSAALVTESAVAQWFAQAEAVPEPPRTCGWADIVNPTEGPPLDADSSSLALVWSRPSASLVFAQLPPPVNVTASPGSPGSDFSTGSGIVLNPPAPSKVFSTRPTGPVVGPLRVHSLPQMGGQAKPKPAPRSPAPIQEQPGDEGGRRRKAGPSRMRAVTNASDSDDGELDAKDIDGAITVPSPAPSPRGSASPSPVGPPTATARPDGRAPPAIPAKPTPSTPVAKPAAATPVPKPQPQPAARAVVASTGTAREPVASAGSTRPPIPSAPRASVPSGTPSPSPVVATPTPAPAPTPASTPRAATPSLAPAPASTPRAATSSSAPVTPAPANAPTPAAEPEVPVVPHVHIQPPMPTPGTESGSMFFDPSLLEEEQDHK